MTSLPRFVLCSFVTFLLPVALPAAGVARDPSSRDPAGNTPLHLVALRGDANAVDALLAAGADPNAVNDAGASPLHYAVASERMVAALLAHGAKPEVMSKIGVTPLLGAAGKPDSYPVVRRLIEAGANINAQRRVFLSVLANANVLTIAIAGGDQRTVEFLLERQAELNPKTGTPPLVAAAMTGNIRIARELLQRGADIDTARNFGTALHMALFAGNPEMARFLIEQGANPTIPSQRGHGTQPIVLSAYNDHGDPTLTKLLVARGVDVNTANEAGETAFSYALKNGSDSELVRYLVAVGAKRPVVSGREKPVPARAVPAPGEARVPIVRQSAQRAVDLLQRNSTAFLENGFVRNVAKCVSCHQQALPAVAFGLARERGLRVDEHEIGRLLAATLAVRSPEAENARQMDEPTPGGGLTLGYDADGLRALGYPADEMWESFSRYLLAQQHRDGSWQERVRRPPMTDGAVVFTAWSLRAVQLYPPAGREREVAAAMRRARAWLRQQPIRTHNDRVFQLLGLAWAGEARAKLEPLAIALLRDQRANGGWAQLPGLDCDAWATGSALVALHKSGLATTDQGYQRGVEFLLRTQFDDGSWWVRSRSFPFQPHFDGRFPHGKDQWISAAGTAWAAIALLSTLEPTVSAASLSTAQQLIAAYQEASQRQTHSHSTARAAITPSKATTIEFARDIQPIFERSCIGCHGGPQPKAAFTLDSRDALLKGGQSGDPAIVPGNADDSPLFRQVSDIIEDLEMPPLNRREKYPALSGDELERLRAWINAGAPWAPARVLGARPAPSAAEMVMSPSR